MQVGSDPSARRFLKVLDDDLVRAGAAFDICDTVTLDEMEDLRTGGGPTTSSE